MEICNGRATEEVSRELIVSLIGEDFNSFPEGTEFKYYEYMVPAALIPKPDGGVVCLAFDSDIPRGFPVISFLKSDHISFDEFEKLRKKSGSSSC